jgi:hypothetical protein
MRQAYACFLFDTNKRKLLGWDVFSEPGIMLTNHSGHVFATIAQSEAATYDEAEAMVTRTVGDLMPGLARGVPIESTSDTALRVAGERIRELEARVSSTLALLPAPVEDKPGDREWYSCAVCSMKTDEPPVVRVRHECCKRDAAIGPCCARAQDNHPDDVLAILGGTNHERGCRGRP